LKFLIALKSNDSKFGDGQMEKISERQKEKIESNGTKKGRHLNTFKGDLTYLKTTVSGIPNNRRTGAEDEEKGKSKLDDLIGNAKRGEEIPEEGKGHNKKKRVRRKEEIAYLESKR